MVYNGASPQRWRPPSNAPKQPNTIESHSHVTSNCELDVVAGTSISSRKVSKAFSTPSASARPGQAQQVVALLVNSFSFFLVEFRFVFHRVDSNFKCAIYDTAQSSPGQVRLVHTE